jgi:hypothetical protein
MRHAIATGPARNATARMTAFNPPQSSPLVNRPMRLVMSLAPVAPDRRSASRRETASY